MKSNKNLPWVKISGNDWDIGVKLGELGRNSVWQFLIKCDLWKEVTSSKHKESLQQLHKNTKQKFPSIYEELQGLAYGLNLNFEDVFAWNCRGDILDSTNDGCTTLQIPGNINYIAHNEDGFPFFLEKCFIAEILNNNNTSFISFCYPGSIPGHTFAVNDKNIVQMVNNLRLKNIKAKLPRMVISRAVLNCNSLENALNLLKENNECGGFNMSLTSSKDRRLFSVEFGGGKIGILEIKKPSLHANHAIYHPLNKSSQIITNSSKDRQKRFHIISINNDKIVPINILRDTKGEGLPIFRTGHNDPDNENTIASAIFKISKNFVEYSFYESNAIIACYKGIIEQRG